MNKFSPGVNGKNPSSSPPSNNPYMDLMEQEYRDWTLGLEARKWKSTWRSKVFHGPESKPLDLEIGTGNGFHFAHLTEKNPHRFVLGLELKYKTLIQSIRRSLRKGCTNGRMARFPAEKINELFAKSEINNVYIHFPDPWPKKRHQKKRLIQDSFLSHLHPLMRPASLLDFKTDSKDYFNWSLERFKKSSFELIYSTKDLHQFWSHPPCPPPYPYKNFVTHFESLFLQKGQPIFHCLLKKEG